MSAIPPLQLADLTRAALKPTTTRVRERDGSVRLESRDERGNAVVEVLAARGAAAPAPEPVDEVELQPRRFNTAAGKWQSDPARGDERLPDSLRCLTLNTWFETRFAYDERLAEQLRLIEQLDADLVALQEVIPEYLAALLAAPFVRANYWLSDTRGTTLNNCYGVVLLSKVRPFSLKMHYLPSRMARCHVFGVFATTSADEPLAVGTVHLESLNSAPARRAQLELCVADLHTCAPASLLMGDFNIGAHRNYEDDGLPLENNALAELAGEYVDGWAALHPTELGFTYDSALNGNLAHTEQMRYDRIILRPGAPAWRFRSIEIIGDKPFASAELRGPCWISDHFGLLAHISR